MKAKTLLNLVAGEYICPIAYKDEYEYLMSDGNQDFVDGWLSAINMKLARLGEGGAFFMAPRQLAPSDANKIRDDFARYRDVYGPANRMLQIIRAGKDEFTLGVGEYIQLAELNQAVNESATLEAQLRSLQNVIRDGSARFKNRELLKKLLEHLQKDGYLIVVNENTEMYRTTGKVTQLTNVLTFLAENTDIVGSGLEAEDEGKDSGLLFDGDQGGEADAGASDGQ